MRWLFRRFKDALRGLWYALLHDNSFRLQVGGILSLTVLILIFFQPLGELELLFLGLAYTLIIITELQNSAFEEAMDRLHPFEHEQMRRSKDMSAGAVLAAGLFLLFVLSVLLLGRIA